METIPVINKACGSGKARTCADHDGIRQDNLCFQLLYGFLPRESSFGKAATEILYTGNAALDGFTVSIRLFTGVPSLMLPEPEVPSSLSVDPEACTSSFPFPSHSGSPSAYHPKAHEYSFQPDSPDLALHEIGTGHRLSQVRSLHIRQRRLSLINLL